MNAYVTGGYGATAGIIGGYAVYLRRRARVLARAVARQTATDPATGGTDDPAEDPPRA